MKKLLTVFLIALTCGCLTLSACKKKTEEAAPLTKESAPAPEAAPAPVPETPQSAK